MGDPLCCRAWTRVNQAQPSPQPTSPKLTLAAPLSQQNESSHLISCCTHRSSSYSCGAVRGCNRCSRHDDLTCISFVVCLLAKLCCIATPNCQCSGTRTRVTSREVCQAVCQTNMCALQVASSYIALTEQHVVADPTAGVACFLLTPAISPHSMPPG